MFRLLRDVGFLNRIRQTAAFCQLLSMSSWHLAHLTNNTEMADHLNYSVHAVQELQKQIGATGISTTDDTLAAILAFAVSAVR